MRICPSCGDVHHEQEYQRCEWCRIGAPMEAALGVSITEEMKKKLGEVMADKVWEELRRPSLLNRITPITREPMPAVHAAFELHASFPFSPTKEK